ncbi:hypothetical protein BAE44_0015230 [Dichanthelium oligosanthes]|uniref:GIR1-like zinc ribbon domain-containing protein n=1 Tax=Dichanthelium oligosanthes TaxID=888268 RepID=A0A1E5VF59_9POAL|nr:hypothetical protein BAE44_0015230 [Dichanthelium oligosanthes]
MSRNNGKVGSKLQELRLSLSRSSRGGAGGPSGATQGGVGGGGSPRRLSSSSSSTASPPSSCVSSEGSPEQAGGAGAPMILAGCPRCMMYVMLSREDPRCPKCHSTVLLDFNDGPAADPRHAGAGGAKSKGRRG